MSEALRADAVRPMERLSRHPRIGVRRSDVISYEGKGRATRTVRHVLGYDAIVSYKCVRCEQAPLPRACIVNFHDRPKPSDFTTGWLVDALKQMSPEELGSRQAFPEVTDNALGLLPRPVLAKRLRLLKH